MPNNKPTEQPTIEELIDYAKDAENHLGITDDGYPECSQDTWNMITMGSHLLTQSQTIQEQGEEIESAAQAVIRLLKQAKELRETIQSLTITNKHMSREIEKLTKKWYNTRQQAKYNAETIQSQVEEIKELKRKNKEYRTHLKGAQTTANVWEAVARGGDTTETLKRLQSMPIHKQIQSLQTKVDEAIELLLAGQANMESENTMFVTKTKLGKLAIEEALTKLRAQLKEKK